MVFTSQLVTNLPATGGPALSSDPSAGVTMGGYFYFAATDGPNGTTGRELWRTDGTSAGTTLVKDINPGAADSLPGQFTVAGTNLFFTANDGMHGSELWKSDGTGAGTVLVADLNPGPGDTPIVALYAGGNSLYFQVGSGADTDWLYRTDGTLAGTVLLVGPGAWCQPTFALLANRKFQRGDIHRGYRRPKRPVADGRDRGGNRAPGQHHRDRQSPFLAVLDPMCYYVLDTGTYYLTVPNDPDDSGFEEDATLYRRTLTPGGTPEDLQDFFNGPCAEDDIV